MSFLEQVLEAKTKVDINNINIKVPKLVNAADKCKSDLLNYLEDVFLRFLERPKQNSAIIQEAFNLQQEIITLKKSAEDLVQNEIPSCDKQLLNHLDVLARVNTSIDVVVNLCTINRNLVSIESYLEDKSYFICMQTIKETEKLIENLFECEQQLLLNKRLLSSKHSLLHELSNIYRDNISISLSENQSMIKIKNENDIFTEVLSALYIHSASISELDRFTRVLWENVLVPVVEYRTSIEFNSEDDFQTMSIVILDKNEKGNYAEVFTNLKNIFKYISTYLNINVTEDITTLQLIARDIRDNLSELIIKQCLKETIPSNLEELAKYNVVAEQTEELENTLKDLHIFDENTTSIVEYTKNIDILFTDKACRGYLQAAQNLMKKDLHDMVEIEAVQIPENSLNFTNNFSKRSISRATVDLLALLEKILEQAKSSSDNCGGRLLCTVQNICKMYASFVPEHHKKLIHTIPQQMALFLNNSMYIAYNLSKWKKTLGPLLNIDSDILIYSGEELEDAANCLFDMFVRNQIGQIEETMRNAGLEQQTLEQVEGNTEKCLRQCLRQQELLKTVWQKVLPYEIYNKTIGVILNSLVNCLAGHIVKFEDISAEAAMQLVELLKMIQTRGVKLFTDPKEINLYVSGWYKLNELVFVLNASLLDINDRWADGKGPLGLQFTPIELKQLIRALFQNTDRRSALLSKIH